MQLNLYDLLDIIHIKLINDAIIIIFLIIS